MEPDVLGHGVAQRDGYVFKIFLGRFDGGEPYAESPRAGARRGDLKSSWDADSCERWWRLYAWPAVAGESGNRAFYIDQEGDMHQALGDSMTYSGLDRPPAYDAAPEESWGAGPRDPKAIWTIVGN